MAINGISSNAAAALIRAGSSAGVQRAQQPEKIDPSKFTALLETGLDKANTTMKAADVAVETMVETQGANLHEAMIALDKAEITARLTSRIGQKLVQAYREVSQMQV